MDEVRQIFYETMRKYNYTFDVAKNNHLSLDTNKESLSIIDMKKYKNGFKFTAVYNKKNNGKLTEPFVKEYSVSYDGYSYTLDSFLLWLDRYTQLNDEYRKMDKELSKKVVNKDKAFEIIVKYYADIDTLETRHSDELDFHDIAVWTLKNCMEEAYKLGFKVGKENNKKS